ncbi:MAG: P-loop NTPase fold protein, partial [Gammaproteobacteria bacterium]
MALPERFGIVITTPRPLADERVIDLEIPAAVPAGVQADYLDAPLTGDQLADVDTLDRRWYAAALANLVMLPDTGPMTIGVHARWGVGKSSFMRFIRWELLRDAMVDQPHKLAALDRADDNVDTAARTLREWDAHHPAAPAAARRRFADAVAWRGRALAKLERAAADTVLCVRFNAWLYEGATQIWAGLTHEITKAMEDSLPWWHRLTTRVRYTLHEHGVGFWVGAAAGVAAAVLLAGLALVLGFGNAGSALAGSLPAGLAVIAKLLPTGSVVAVGLLLAWRLSRGFVPVSGRVAQYLRRPDYRVQMGYQHQLRRDIEFLKARLRRNNRTPRVVVFIDDLDRCSDERVLETLQAINLLLTESGFYVFLGIDTEMIINAI